MYILIIVVFYKQYIIDSVRLVEYSFKDLRDARILETYEL